MVASHLITGTMALDVSIRFWIALIICLILIGMTRRGSAIVLQTLLKEKYSVSDQMAKQRSEEDDFRPVTRG